MNPQVVKENIISWTSTCLTSANFDCIQLAVNNCLLPLKMNYPVEAVDDAERDIEQAVYDRKVYLGLIDRRPTDDESTDNDSALEGNYSEHQPTDIIN